MPSNPDRTNLPRSRRLRRLTRRTAVSLIACLLAGLTTLRSGPDTTLHAASQPSEWVGRPDVRLVLFIAVDQFRADYLTRFGAPQAGFRTLLTNGAVFTDAYLEHGYTVTAVGHSTMLTGAYPSVSGIIGNSWFERSTRTAVESITDTSVQIVGTTERAGVGASPRRLLVTTLGDQVKLAARTTQPGAAEAPKVIGISIKDRSAILPSGHSADGAYFVRGGKFVTSTYYRDKLPDWVQAVNDQKIIDSYAGKRWEFEGGVRAFPAKPGAALDSAVLTSPIGNELVLAMVKGALEHEKLGQRGVTDVLTVSFSSNDSVGHSYGPESPEVRAITRETDRQLQTLFEEVDRRVGLQHTLIALTADHGAMPLPEAAVGRNVPAGRFKSAPVLEAIDAALDAKYGQQSWIAWASLPAVYLDETVIANLKLDPAEVRRVAAEAAMPIEHVARVYTRDDLLGGRVADDVISARMTRAYNRQRSGDLMVVLDPMWTTASSGTSHGTPYSYDAHIPLIIMGPGVEPGTYHAHAALNDLAPTLAAILGVEPPSGSQGRVLHEALKPNLRRPALMTATASSQTAP